MLDITFFVGESHDVPARRWNPAAAAGFDHI
jgi:hypothetical protein